MKYGFIGCGNMGSALAKALSKQTTDILLSSKSGTSAAALAESLGCNWTDSNLRVAGECDVILLAVKPQVMEAVLGPLVEVLNERRPILISMAAGISLSKIGPIVGAEIPVIRIMPNTPVAIGKGLITYCCNKFVDTSRVAAILKDFSGAGTFDRVDESKMDAATAAAGCSPAYTFMFIEAIADGAVACGLPREQALLYAATAVAGAAELMLQSGKHPGELKDAVCSPGGSTIAGVRALEDNGFRGSVMEAICAAYKRNLELGN